MQVVIHAPFDSLVGREIRLRNHDPAGRLRIAIRAMADSGDMAVRAYLQHYGFPAALVVAGFGGPAFFFTARFRTGESLTVT